MNHNIYQKYSQKEDYGKVPEYINEKRRLEAEAQREYDAYVQVCSSRPF